MQTHLFCESCAGTVLVDAEPGGEAPCPTCGLFLAVPDSYDVFISYKSEDAEPTRKVATALGDAGICYWLDADRLRAGDVFTREIAHALKRTKILLLILSSRTVESPEWVHKEVVQAVSHGCSIVPLLVEDFPLPEDWSFLLIDHQYELVPQAALDSGCRSVVDRVQAQLRRRALSGESTSDGAEQAKPVEERELKGVVRNECPYQGPRPFPRGARHFYGREAEAEQLLQVIDHSRVTLVYAPSGAGKSSLLSTLVTRHLEENHYEVNLDARVGGALPQSTELSRVQNVYTYAAIYGMQRSGLPEPHWGLGDFLRSQMQRSWTRGRVLIFDQFEELFTRHDDRWEDRSRFFDDLGSTLEELPNLRIVLAIRQEYLANIKELEVRLPKGLRPQHFALRRIDDEGALAAIRDPACEYAEFAPGVAEEIFEELATIRVGDPDGRPMSKRAEYIELVHLQVVCARLWKKLPQGITRIEREHVERVAGEGKDVAAFVQEALESFFDETVDQVAGASNYPESLIRFGCMKFIATSTMTRTLIRQSNSRVGRLPAAIVKQLEESHLVRAEERGGEIWYELSHDLLAAMVGRQLDRKVSDLLYATDVLAKALERTRQSRAGSLQGYFEEHQDILTECAPFHREAGLFPDEAEFVFRASLTAGRDMVEWSRRLADDCPQERIEVLRDACRSSEPAVRRNAATLLGLHSAPELDSELTRLALSDADASVRHAAGVSLARLDRKELFTNLLDLLKSPAHHAGTIRALARVRIEADNRFEAPLFEHAFDSLAGALRRQIRWRARFIRLKQGLGALGFRVLPAGAFAAASAALVKMLPASLNWAVVQATPSAAMGAFHGLTAGILWAGLITLCVGLYHIVFGRDLGRRSLLRPLGAVVAGMLGGVLSSAVVVGVLVLVFTPASLQQMGWLPSGSEALMDAFTETRFGWVHLITGTGIGIGMALTINGVRASPVWRRFLEAQSQISSTAQLKSVLRRLTEIVLPQYWPIPTVIGLAAVVAFFVPDTCSVPAECSGSILPLEQSMNASPIGLALGLFGDWLTQTVGAFFGIVGYFLGAVAWRHGFRVTSVESQ